MSILNLSSKGLTDIPKIPNNVIELDLSYNQITEIKPNSFPSGLKELTLSCNQLTEIHPNSFPHELKILNLRLQM